MGLLTALTLFVKEGSSGRHARLMLVAQRLMRELTGVASISARIILDPEQTGMPVVEVKLDENNARLKAIELTRQLRAGSPSIEVNPCRPDEGFLILSPACLGADDPPAIGKRLREILGDRSPLSSG